MLGWHFLSDDCRMQFGRRTKVKAGETYSAKGSLEMCVNGMHASKRILDALKNAPGPIVCRVELKGAILFGSDKAAARERHVFWMLDVTNILHEFACRCAEDALALMKQPDRRSIAAIRAKRDWLKRKITDKQLAANRRECHSHY